MLQPLIMEISALQDELIVRVLASLIANIKSGIDDQLCRSGCASLAAMSKTCRRYRDAIAHAGLWPMAAQVVIWPMSVASRCICPTETRTSQARLIRKVGSGCHTLHVKCLQLLEGEFAMLTESCPSVKVLSFSYYGPEGVGGLDWVSVWQSTLRCLSIHLWYDDCLGPPLVDKLISSVLSGCEALDELHLTGVDWPRAKVDIKDVFWRYRAEGIQKPLRRLSLEGTELWAKEEIDALSSAGTAVEIRKTTYSGGC